MTAEEYTIEVVTGRLNDPTLSFQLHLGFHVTAVIGDYFSGDPESRGWAAIIEWRNEEVTMAGNDQPPDPRFIPGK